MTLTTSSAYIRCYEFFLLGQMRVRQILFGFHLDSQECPHDAGKDDRVADNPRCQISGVSKNLSDCEDVDTTPPKAVLFETGPQEGVPLDSPGLGAWISTQAGIFEGLADSPEGPSQAFEALLDQAHPSGFALTFPDTAPSSGAPSLGPGTVATGSCASHQNSGPPSAELSAPSRDPVAGSRTDNAEPWKGGAGPKQEQPATGCGLRSENASGGSRERDSGGEPGRSNEGCFEGGIVEDDAELVAMLDRAAVAPRPAGPVEEDLEASSSGSGGMKAAPGGRPKGPWQGHLKMGPPGPLPVLAGDRVTIHHSVLQVSSFPSYNTAASILTSRSGLNCMWQFVDAVPSKGRRTPSTPARFLHSVKLC